jgi:uncharacterized membrane protein HdeD (DUF308 family)
MSARAVMSLVLSGTLITREITLLSELGAVWGLYAVLDGAAVIAITAPRVRRSVRFTAFLAQGVVSVVAGAVAMLVPPVWGFLVAVLIPIWAVVHAALTFVGAARVRMMFRPVWLIASAGVITLALASLFFSNPGGGLPWLTSLMAAYGAAHGLLLLTLGFGIVRRIAG